RPVVTPARGMSGAQGPEVELPYGREPFRGLPAIGMCQRGEGRETSSISLYAGQARGVHASSLLLTSWGRFSAHCFEHHFPLAVSFFCWAARACWRRRKTELCPPVRYSLSPLCVGGFFLAGAFNQRALHASASNTRSCRRSSLPARRLSSA